MSGVLRSRHLTTLCLDTITSGPSKSGQLYSDLSLNALQLFFPLRIAYRSSKVAQSNHQNISGEYIAAR